MSTPESWRISSRSLEVLRVTPSSYSPSSSSSALEPLPFVTLSKIERGRSFLPTSAISLFDYICRADHIFTGSLRACVCLAITHETVVVTGFSTMFKIFSKLTPVNIVEPYPRYCPSLGFHRFKQVYRELVCQSSRPSSSAMCLQNSRPEHWHYLRPPEPQPPPASYLPPVTSCRLSLGLP